MGTNIFDKYSIFHATVGMLMSLLGLEWYIVLILHTIFEIVENTHTAGKIIRKYLWWWPGGKVKPDSVLNTIGDTISVMLGWLVGYLLSDYPLRSY